MAVQPSWAALLADMREFAGATHLGKTGFMSIQSKRGAVPIWIEDINKCTTDEELVALIRKCIA